MTQPGNATPSWAGHGQSVLAPSYSVWGPSTSRQGWDLSQSSLAWGPDTNGTFHAPSPRETQAEQGCVHPPWGPLASVCVWDPSLSSAGADRPVLSFPDRGTGEVLAWPAPARGLGVSTHLLSQGTQVLPSLLGPWRALRENFSRIPVGIVSQAHSVVQRHTCGRRRSFPWRTRLPCSSFWPWGPRKAACVFSGHGHVRRVERDSWTQSSPPGFTKAWSPLASGSSGPGAH